MSRRLTIVHAIEKNRLTTGSVVQMMEAARGLAARNHRVTVAAPPGGDLERACERRTASAFLPMPLAGSFDVASARTLRRHLQGTPTDVIHVHKGRAHSVALLAATGLGSRPLVVVNRGVTFPLDRFNRWKYRHPRVGAVVCVAEAGSPDRHFERPARSGRGAGDPRRHRRRSLRPAKSRRLRRPFRAGRETGSVVGRSGLDS